MDCISSIEPIDSIKIDNTNNIKFEDYILRWLELYKKTIVRPKTYDTIESCIKSLINRNIGYIPLKSIDANLLQHLFNKLIDDGYSYGTIKKVKDIINSCLKSAAYNEDIKKNYMEAVILPPQKNFKNKPPEILDKEDFYKFINEAIRMTSKGTPVYRYGNGLIFILYTGLRVGEALSLKWKDIDYKNKSVDIVHSVKIIKNRNQKECKTNYIKIIDKTETPSSNRTVPLCNNALYFLSEFKKIIKPNNDNKYIFSTKNNDIVAGRYLLTTIKKIAKRANLKIENCTVHTLRHTFASMLFEQDVDAKLISELLGHSQVKLTYDFYIHTNPKAKYNAVKKLD